jgi:hypothetical protein
MALTDNSDLYVPVSENAIHAAAAYQVTTAIALSCDRLHCHVSRPGIREVESLETVIRLDSYGGIHDDTGIPARGP